MKKILVVDDTKNIRLMLSKCLELEGYEVKTAIDGKEALELIASLSFDLIFLDIKLPEIRGTEVLKRIREMGVGTPVIIITAYATIKNAIECTNMGAVAYLQKPFTAEKIKSVLSAMSPVNASSKVLGYLKQSEELIRKGKLSEASALLKEATFMLEVEKS